MSYKKYIGFDCETTGVDDKCNLLTVCFLILDNKLNIIDKLNLSLKQNDGYVIFPKALEINKIDIIKHHNNSYELIDARNLLINFLNKHKTQYNLIPIGHNISFDIKFIIMSGLLTKNEYSNYISCNPIDTISIAQFLKLSGKIPENQSISLINLCNYFKLNKLDNIDLQHTSEYDIKMTIQLLKKFKMINNQNECNTISNNDYHILKKRKIEYC